MCCWLPARPRSKTQYGWARSRGWKGYIPHITKPLSKPLLQYFYGKGIKSCCEFAPEVVCIRHQNGECLVLLQGGHSSNVLKREKAKMCILRQFHFSTDFSGYIWLNYLISGNWTDGRTKETRSIKARESKV